MISRLFEDAIVRQGEEIYAYRIFADKGDGTVGITDWYTAAVIDYVWDDIVAAGYEPIKREGKKGDKIVEVLHY